MTSARDDDGVRAAVWQSVSVAVATSLYAVSFGALAVAAGLDVPQTAALSLLMFTGGSQFAFIGVIGAGGAAAAAIATAGMLGVRNALYGVRVAPLLGASGWRRPLAAHFTIDESAAVSTSQPTPAATRAGFWWTGAGIYVLWNAFTLVGALLGDALGDPRRYGLDAAAPAAFLALVWPRLGGGAAGRLARLTALSAVVVALALTPFVPSGIPVLAAAVVAIAIGWTRPGAPAGEPRTSPGPSDDAVDPRASG